MCWITLTPKDGSSKRKHHHHHHPHIPHISHPHLHVPHSPHHHHHHHRRHSYHHDDSTTEHLVRRNHVTESYEKLRLRIVTPSSSTSCSPPRHHHHTYHDRHPLYLNPVPIKLCGPGRKRTPIIPPPITIPLPERMPPKEDPIYHIQPFPDISPKPKPKPKPKVEEDDPIFRIQPFPDLGRPSRSPRSPSRRRDSGTGDDGDEPTYRIQPIYEVREPRGMDREVRENTRAALERNERSGGGGRTIRRVRGYDVLARRVPWSWECVSSGGGSSVR